MPRHPDTESDAGSRDIGSQTTVTRREVLRLAATALLPQALAKSTRPKKIIVAGAGIGGLSCAWELVRRGHDVTVLSPSPLELERAHGIGTREDDVAYAILRMERENLIAQLRKVAQVADWDPQTSLALSLRRLGPYPRPA